jgi:hypothetical protein
MPPLDKIFRHAEWGAGGILTVADDILQNDGRRFIEMMENLAERRLKRQANANDHYPPLNGQHSSPHQPAPPDDDEDFDDEEDDEEYEDSQEDSFDDEQVR